ncbi:MAG: hypothetical protein ACRDHZ_21575 [Ktedonobacteraceae bacterium]
MTRFAESLEILKRAAIALIFLALGCISGTAIAQGVLEIFVGNFGVHWWLGVNWWLVATVSLPWVGTPLALILFIGYLVYLCYIDELAPTLGHKQQPHILKAYAPASLASDLTNGLIQEQARSKQVVCEQE